MLKRLIRLFPAAVLMLIVGTVAVFAQSDLIRIDFPPSDFVISGTVDVYGSIDTPNLRSYILEVTDSDAADAIWTPVTLNQRQVPDTGILGQWDTTLTGDGVYRLRATAFLTDGSTISAEVTGLRVQNAGAVVRPTAVQATPTPEGPVIAPRPSAVNPLPIMVGGQMDELQDSAVELIHTAGMTWIKWQIPYTIGDASLIDVARDRINFTHEHGMYAFLSVKGSKDEMAAVGFGEYFPQYAQFVGQLAELQPDAIQIWNEMNLDREWPHGSISPRDYTDLLRQSYEAIKAVDPSIRVVTGAPAPTGAEGAFGLDAVWNDDRYYAGMASAGAQQYSDCIGVHYNEGIVPPTATSGDPRDPYPTRYLPSMIQRAAGAFASSGRPVHLCFSEMGYLSPDGYGTLPAGFEWGASTSVQEQAEWLRGAIQYAASTGQVDLIIVFNVNYTRFVDNDPQGGYAIIRPDGTCPACDALATLRTS
ncbi:MAG: hypothetical protein U0670_12185 [Anaerolineae bacterium]